MGGRKFRVNQRDSVCVCLRGGQRGVMGYLGI